MSELAERARELAEEVIHETKFVDVVESAEIVRLIEQALLAERRLAIEEAAKIAATKSEEWTDRIRTDEHSRGMADGADFVAMALRAAAEKEVGK